MKGTVVKTMFAGLLLLLATACGSSTPAPIEGCTETATEELFVASLHSCPDKKVYQFADQQARDQWRTIATGNGTVVTGEGDTWLTVKP